MLMVDNLIGAKDGAAGCGVAGGGVFRVRVGSWEGSPAFVLRVRGAGVPKLREVGGFRERSMAVAYRRWIADGEGRCGSIVGAGLATGGGSRRSGQR
jgi:hypothetical protein